MHAPPLPPQPKATHSSSTARSVAQLFKAAAAESYVNPHLKIDNIKLLIKEGGKSGLWKNPEGLPEFLKEIF